MIPTIDRLPAFLIALLVALLGMLALTVVAGGFGLPLLRRLNVGEQVRDDGPKSHFKKSGTPTFGGLFFLIPLIVTAIVTGITHPELQVLSALALLILGFAVAGFLDDYIKVRVSKKGLSVRQKSLIMAAVSVLFTIYYLYFAPQQPFFLLPFSHAPIAITGFWKLPYGIFVVLYLFFVTNAVNITDGVDGLCSSVTSIAGIGLAGAATYQAVQFARWSLVFSDPARGRLYEGAADNARSAALLAAAVVGGCLGFLVFNRHPAKIFMGDTGSQALGAAMAGIALIVGAPWLILFFGAIYIIEAFSVIIQVAYFKKTGGKRIFRMSPIHHHYELGGWKEWKIVGVFSLVTAIGSAIGFLLVLS